MSYTRNARILSLGIATTGLVTFAFFSLASHALTKDEYGGISLLWSVMFVILSTIYRPIEQLLSRTIAQRRAHGLDTNHPLRVPLLLQAGFACIFLIAALALRQPIEEHLFNGSHALYFVLVAGTVAYAASYAARGWLAGHEQFGLYGGLVLLESSSRCCFALAVVIGLAHGQTAVALGIFAAPLVSLLVVPASLRRQANKHERSTTTNADTGKNSQQELSLQHGARFAVAVFFTMLAEQTLINGAVLTTYIREGEAALAGIVFNLFLITRAPLQLFQAIQGSLLPHLASLNAQSDHAAVHRAIRGTVLAIGGFALLVATVMTICGPFAMHILFPTDGSYGRVSLIVVALGMGTHLIAGTLTQATLARHREVGCSIAWVAAATIFLSWMITAPISDVMLRASIGYIVATGLLAGLLIGLLERSQTDQNKASQ